MKSHNIPTVLIIAGNDPSGGAGLAADIQTVSAYGCHPLPVISALTVQDSVNVRRIEPVSTELLQQQLETICADTPPDAIKIGMVGSVENLSYLKYFLGQHTDIPVVLDPILRAGGGANISSDVIEAAIIALLPLVTLLTPNTPEALRLSHQSDEDRAAAILLEYGTQAVAITGTHAESREVINRLYQKNGPRQQRAWPRLPFSYHGSGCTFASAAVAQLALGRDLSTLFNEIQYYCWNTLKQAPLLGKGQHTPLRMPRDKVTPSADLYGLYAITDSKLTPGNQLIPAVEEAILGGARVVQYRDKSSSSDRRLKEATALLQCCRQHGIPLLINDDIDLAARIGADGVHLGEEDGLPELARRRLGASAIIGVSCYNSIKLAKKAENAGADYVAFGRFFTSKSKPHARPAEITTLQQAKSELSLPIVAIGGITSENSGQLIAAGADMVAVIGALFAGTDPRRAAQQFLNPFNSHQG